MTRVWKKRTPAWPRRVGQSARMDCGEEEANALLLPQPGPSSLVADEEMGKEGRKEGRGSAERPFNCTEGEGERESGMCTMGRGHNAPSSAPSLLLGSREGETEGGRDRGRETLFVHCVCYPATLTLARCCGGTRLARSLAARLARSLRVTQQHPRTNVPMKYSPNRGLSDCTYSMC